MSVESRYKVGAVVLNWNDADATLRCVRSMQEAEQVPDPIVIVDNGSTDSSSTALRRGLDGRCRLIETGSNLGYAGGLRPGIECCLDRQADLIWLLNNDTVVGPSALRALLDSVDRHGLFRMYSPKILQENEPDRVFFAGRRLDKRTGEFQLCATPEGADGAPPSPDIQSDVVQGSCFLVPSRVIREIGFMTEDYFLYMEEYDYSFRLRRRGGECFCVLDAVTLHACGQASDATSPRLEPVRAYYRARNQILFWKRWCPIAQTVPFVVRHAVKQFKMARVRGFRDDISRARLLGVWHGLAGRAGCVYRP